MEPAWAIANEIPNIVTGELHLWKARLKGELAVRDESLAEDERLKMERFHFAADRLRFGFGRVLLRRLLGGYLQRPPEEIQFRYTEFGKPYLSFEPGQTKLEFNISHSGDIILFAFAQGVPVGVDVERIKPLPELEQIARRFFSPGEQKDLEMLTGPEKVTAFYRCWTRKESIIKACGEGLSMPLGKFQVSLLPATPARLLRSPDQNSWLLLDVVPGQGYAAAVAAQREHVQVHFFSTEGL